MIDLTIKKEMLAILSSMKGKTLKSIEGRYDFDTKTFMELVRFILGRFVVEFVSDYVPVKWHWNNTQLFQDEATCFSVQRKMLTEKRVYPKGNTVVQFMKNEIVSEILVVRDSITNNNDDEILVDSGIAIKTNEKVYTFSRCDISGFWIHMNESDKIDMFYSVKAAKEDCSDSENGLTAKIKREYFFL